MNSNIPKIIIQTGFSINNDSDSKNHIIELNPGYKYEYYNNNDCINFIKKHFNSDVLSAFNKLKPGAFKADIFRYCYLYINGGIYIDLDLLPKIPFDDLIINNVDFISCLENRSNRKIDGIYQAFIACKKKIDFFKTAIDKIVVHTNNNYYPEKLHSDIWIDILSITGPVLLYNSINFEKRPNCGKTSINNINIYLYSFNGDIYDLNKNLIIKNGIKYSQCNSYSHLFKKKDIYN